MESWENKDTRVQRERYGGKREINYCRTLYRVSNKGLSEQWFKHTLKKTKHGQEKKMEKPERKDIGVHTITVLTSQSHIS